MSRSLRSLAGSLSPSRRLRVTDVGANPIGDAAYKALLDEGLCEVFGFEPQPEAFAKLAGIKSEAETYFEAAIGDPSRTTLHLHKKSGFVSLFPLDREALRQIDKDFWCDGAKGTIPVSPKPLDAIEGLPRIDVLKMDLQGGELDVLKGGMDRLAETIAIVTEVRFHRMYAGEPLFSDIDLQMRAMGFKLYKFMFTKSVMMPHEAEADIIRGRMTSQLLDGDAVYLRDGVLAEVLSDDQLMWLAFTADAMLDAPDLSLMCLTALKARGRCDRALIDDYVRVLPRKLKEK